MSQTIQFVIDVEVEDDEIDLSHVDISSLELTLDDDPETTDIEYSWASRKVEP
jgi:hypothetical protein